MSNGLLVEPWKTDDMALAAYLMFMGDDVKDLEWEMDSCYFCFEETDDLLDHVQDFVSGDALVEPRRFNMIFGQLKKRMFGNKPRRSAIA